MWLRLLEESDIPALWSLWPKSRRPDEGLLPVLRKCVADGRGFGATILDDDRTVPLAFGLSTFVRPEFVQNIMQNHDTPIVNHMLELESRGHSVMLTPAEIAVANSGKGLHAMTLCYCQRFIDPALPLTHETMAFAHVGFRQAHEGYRLQAIWQEGSPDEEAWILSGGMRVKQRRGSDPRHGLTLYGCTREDFAADWPGNTASFLFRSSTCQLHLTPAQRRVASLALWMLKDEDIARRLAISVDTVRQHWRQILQRVEDHYPSALGKSSARVGASRGPEKRRYLLEYLRHNLHELRPIAAPRRKPPGNAPRAR